MEKESESGRNGTRRNESQGFTFTPFGGAGDVFDFGSGSLLPSTFTTGRSQYFRQRRRPRLIPPTNITANTTNEVREGEQLISSNNSTNFVDNFWQDILNAPTPPTPTPEVPVITLPRFEVMEESAVNRLLLYPPSLILPNVEGEENEEDHEEIRLPERRRRRTTSDGFNFDFGNTLRSIQLPRMRTLTDNIDHQLDVIRRFTPTFNDESLVNDTSDFEEFDFEEFGEQTPDVERRRKRKREETEQEKKLIEPPTKLRKMQKSINDFETTLNSFQETTTKYISELTHLKEMFSNEKGNTGFVDLFKDSFKGDDKCVEEMFQNSENMLEKLLDFSEKIISKGGKFDENLRKSSCYVCLEFIDVDFVFKTGCDCKGILCKKCADCWKRKSNQRKFSCPQCRK